MISKVTTSAPSIVRYVAMLPGRRRPENKISTRTAADLAGSVAAAGGDSSEGGGGRAALHGTQRAATVRPSPVVLTCTPTPAPLGAGVQQAPHLQRGVCEAAAPTPLTPRSMGALEPAARRAMSCSSADSSCPPRRSPVNCERLGMPGVPIPPTPTTRIRLGYLSVSSERA